MYVTADGRIAMEHELVMGPDAPNWRDPNTVPEQELKMWIRRVQDAHDAYLERDLRKMPEAWADFCQITGYPRLKSEKEREREFAELRTPVSDTSFVN
jgi:hypothetical protein